MGTTLDKTITRNSGNTVAIDTNYSELNTKADAIVEDVVSHVEAQLATTETALQTAEGLVDTKIASLLSVGDTGYTKDVVDVNLANQINALAPYSGYTQVSKKLDNFVFKEDANFTYKVADKNRYVKFGDTVVDTYGHTEVFLNVQEGYNLITEIPANKTVVLTASGMTDAYIYVYDSSSTSNLIDGFPLKQDGEIVFNSGVTDNLRVRVFSTGANTNVDNISVKEIQTADFTDTAPTVAEIITDGSNSTSGAVSKGEYVLDGSELVTNGTFDSDSDWIDSTGSGSNPPLWTIGSGIATSSSSGYMTQPSGYDLIGEIVSIQYEVKSSISGTLYGVFGSGGSGNLKSIPISIGVHTVTGLITSNGDLGFYTANFVGSIDNISIKRVSDTFQATRDSGEMYDQLVTSASSPVVFTAGSVVYSETDCGTGKFQVGHFYKLVGGNGSTYNANGFDVPSNAIDLGTADSMSLANPYFQDKTQIGVTHQSLAYHAYNTITSAYEGIKTEILLTDTNAGDTTKEVMLANGFSEASEFLYSKGSYLCLPVGLAQMLNSGAYHPVLNSRGVKPFYNSTLNNGFAWYQTPLYQYDETLANCFSQADTSSVIGGSVNDGGNQRPDSKFYDIIYSDQFKDLREYAKIANKYEIELLREDKRVNGCVDEVSIVEAVQLSASGSSKTAFLVYKTDPKPSASGCVYHSGQASRVDYIVDYSESYWQIFTEDAITRTVNSAIIYTSTNPIISSNTKLSIDLIGSPDNYPDVVKTRLASGIGVNGVYPLLVSDEGVDLVPDGTSKNFKLQDKLVGYGTAVFFTDGVYNIGLRWADDDYFERIDNSHIYAMPSAQVAIASYTSANTPYIQCDPKPVLEVTPKAIASNSHSIYKGGDIASQVSGKITVGDGTNGYESRVLENGEVEKEVDTLDIGKTYSVNVGELYKIGSGYDDQDIMEEGSYKRVTGSYTWNMVASLSLSDGPYWLSETNIGTTPQHNTITLDNSVSSSAKWFETLEEDENGNVYAGVYGEEMVYDTTFGDGDDFAQLTNGTDIDLNGNTVKTFHGSNPLNIKMK